MDTSLLQTVYFVLGERKLLHFLLIQPTYYVNLDTFYGPLSVHIYIFLLASPKNKQSNKQTDKQKEHLQRHTATAVANYSGPGEVNLNNRAGEETRRQTFCDKWTINLFVITFLPNFTFL